MNDTAVAAIRKQSRGALLILLVFALVSAATAAEGTIYLRASYFTIAFLQSAEAARVWIPTTAWLYCGVCLGCCYAIWLPHRSAFVLLAVFWLFNLGVVARSYFGHLNAKLTLTEALVYIGVVSYAVWLCAGALSRALRSMRSDARATV